MTNVLKYLGGGVRQDRFFFLKDKAICGFGPFFLLSINLCMQEQGYELRPFPLARTSSSVRIYRNGDCARGVQDCRLRGAGKGV